MIAAFRVPEPKKEYIDKATIRVLLLEEGEITMRGAKIIDDFPAADVRPVVRGHWIPTGETAEIYGDVYRCSVCGCTDVDEVDYCPNCGARMEEQT